MKPFEARYLIIKNAVRQRVRDFVFAEDTILIALAVLIGLMASLGASGFVELINFFKREDLT